MAKGREAQTSNDQTQIESRHVESKNRMSGLIDQIKGLGRLENTKAPDKGFFGRMLDSVKTATRGWNGKYAEAQPIAKSEKVIEHIEPGQAKRNEIITERAKKANTFEHDGKKINLMIESLQDRINFEESSKLKDSFGLEIVDLPKILELKAQLKRWEAMKDKIVTQVSDTQNPNARRHNEVVQNVEKQQSEQQVDLMTISNQQFEDLNLKGELTDDKQKELLQIYDSSLRSISETGKEQINNSLSNFKAETLVFPTDENGKSVLTRKVLETYGDLSLRELAEIKRSNSEDPKIIDSLILYKSRKPDQYLNGGDYDKWAQNLPINPSTREYKDKIDSIKSTEQPILYPTEQISKSKPSKQNKSWLNEIVKTGLTTVGEAASSNYEKGVSLLNLIRKQEKIPAVITQEYANLLIQKFENPKSIQEGQNILNQLEKSKKLGEFASKCTQAQLETIKTYASDYQESFLENFNV